MESGRNAYYGQGASYSQQEIISRGSGSREGINAWAELISQLQTMINENEKLQQTIRRNTDEIEAKTRDFQKVLREKEEELQRANKKYWDVRVSVLGFKARIMKLNGEIQQLQSKQNQDGASEQAAATSDSSLTFKQDMERLQKEMEQLKVDNQKLENERQSMKQTSSQMGHQVHSLEAEVNHLNRQIDQLQSQLKQKRGDCMDLDNNVHQLQTSLQIVTQEKQELERRLFQEQSKRVTPTPRPRINPQQQRELELLRAELSTTKEALLAAETQQQFANSSMSGSQQQQARISELQRELDKTKNDIAREKRAREGAEQQLRTSRTETKLHKSQNDDLKQKSDELTKDIESKNKEINQLKAQLKRASSEQAKTPVVVQGERHDATAKKLVTARKENRELIIRVDELSERLRRMEQVVHSKDRMVESLQSREQETQQLLGELQEEKEQLRKELDVKIESEDNLGEKVYSLEQENAQVQNQMRFVQDELQNYKESLHAAEVQQAKLQSELMKQDKKKKQEESDWENFIHMHTVEVQKMNDQLAKLRSESNRLQQEVRRLDSDKDRLQQKLDAKQKECLDSVETSRMWKEQVDVIKSDYREERLAREKMVREMSMLHQAKQRSDQELTVLRDQVTKQRSQIAVLKDLVDQDTGLDTSDYVEPRVDPVLGGTPHRHAEEMWSPSAQGFGGNQFQSPDMIASQERASQERMQQTTPNPKPPMVNTNRDYGMGKGEYGYISPMAGIGTNTTTRTGAYTDIRPATNAPQPYQHQHMEMMYEARVPMPGEIPNQSQPTMACPICNREDFTTQTELEVHSAKCMGFPAH